MARNCGIVAMVALAILTGCGGKSKNPQAQMTTQSQQGMTVVLESPGLGTLETPIPVKASATSPNGISGWVVYVDNTAVVTLNNFSNSLSATVEMGGGTHILYVRVWDTSGVNFVTSPTLQVDVQGTQATVSPATPGSTQSASGQPSPPAPPPSAAAPPPPPPPPDPPSPLPGVPGDAKVWNGIQNMDGWDGCSACAGGSSVTDNFWTGGWEGSPSMSGSSREFFVGGPPWGAALWIKKLGAQNWASHFLWDFWVRFDSTSAEHTWTAEYDLWQAMGGQEFMIGSHCNFGEGHWDIWDSGNNRWASTDISCSHFSPDEWHHIQWYVERWGAHQYHYGILIVDGNVHNLDRTFDTNPIDWNDGIGVQWQLDQDSSGAPLHEWVDNVKLSIW